MEVGDQTVDDAEPEARRDEQLGLARADCQRVAACHGGQRRRLQRAQRGGAGGDDRSRHAAQPRRSPPRCRRGTSYHSLCMRCSARSRCAPAGSVPAPTCSVTAAVRTPRRDSASSTPASKCSDAVGAATAPARRANTLLIALASTGRRRRCVMYGGSGTWPWRSSRAQADRRASAGGTSSRRHRRGPAPRHRTRRRSADRRAAAAATC